MAPDARVELTERTAPHLTLASASPRRRDLLRSLGLDFHVAPSEVEEVFETDVDAEDVARNLALAKARGVASVRLRDVVLGADTLVVVGEGQGEEILGKPADAFEAAAMLGKLSGCVHRVITGIAVVWHSGHSACNERSRIEAVTTRVVFRTLTPDEIGDYVASGEPLDKAGAYAIQGGAARFVERVEGDYYNVVGLSLDAAIRLLRGLVPVGAEPPPPPPMPFPILP